MRVNCFSSRIGHAVYENYRLKSKIKGKYKYCTDNSLIEVHKNKLANLADFHVALTDMFKLNKHSLLFRLKHCTEMGTLKRLPFGVSIYSHSNLALWVSYQFKTASLVILNLVV